MKMGNLWMSPIIAAALLMITLIVNPLSSDTHAAVLNFDTLSSPAYVPYDYGGFDWDGALMGIFQLFQRILHLCMFRIIL